MVIMNSSAHLTMSSPAHKSVRKPKARRGRPRSSSSKNGAHANASHSAEPQLAAAGSLTRTKALLLAALRVWELKHRIGE